MPVRQEESDLPWIRCRSQRYLARPREGRGSEVVSPTITPEVTEVVPRVGFVLPAVYSPVLRGGQSPSCAHSEERQLCLGSVCQHSFGRLKGFLTKEGAMTGPPESLFSLWESACLFTCQAPKLPRRTSLPGPSTDRTGL